jgi:acetoin utilization deacetylase AcuC-like enzyme
MCCAESYCESRIISALEGGYNLDALAASVAVHVKTLMGL